MRSVWRRLLARTRRRQRVWLCWSEAGWRVL